MNCLAIVERYLREFGYDGLCSSSGGDCGCGLEDGIMPCGSADQDCSAAFRVNWEDCPERADPMRGCIYNFVVAPADGCHCYMTTKAGEE